MNNKNSSKNKLHVWVSPPDKPVPITKSPIRFAIGNPNGASSNSWRAWVQGKEIYVCCRDNFREFKVSLHASGIWRVALREEAIQANPNLKTVDGDRVISRREVDVNEQIKPIIGFQLLVLKSGLYLNPAQRKEWPRSVIFAEPPLSDEEMTFISVVVVPHTETLITSQGERSAVIGKLPLESNRSVQIVVSHDSSATVKPLINEAYKKIGNKIPNNLSKKGVYVVHGLRPDETPWISALKIRKKNRILTRLWRGIASRSAPSNPSY